MTMKKPSGARITRKQAHDMIEAYKSRAEKPGKEKALYFLISKSVLLEALAPVDCEYLSLHIGIKPGALAHPDYEANSKMETTYVDTDHTLIFTAADDRGHFLKTASGKGDGDDEGGTFYDDIQHVPPYPPGDDSGSVI